MGRARYPPRLLLLYLLQPPNTEATPWLGRASASLSPSKCPLFSTEAEAQLSRKKDEGVWRALHPRVGNPLQREPGKAQGGGRTC